MRLSLPELLAIWDRVEASHPADRGRAILACAGGHPSAEDSPGEPSLGAQNARLLALYEENFGRRLDCSAACAECGTVLEFRLDARALRSEKGPDAEVSAETSHELEHEGIHVSFRLLTAADLASVAWHDDADAARAELIARCVQTARRGDEELAGRELPGPVLEALGERLAALDPLAELAVELACVDCGHAQELQLEPASFLWTRIRATVERLLGEVHLLAGAYGWSEAEILALAPGRRRYYLDLATATTARPPAVAARYPAHG